MTIVNFQLLLLSLILLANPLQIKGEEPPGKSYIHRTANWNIIECPDLQERCF